MRYGGLIRDSFWITVRNRYLWFFGFFVAGGVSFGFQPPTPIGGFGDDPTQDTSPGWLSGLAQWVSENVVLVAVVAAALALVTTLVFIALMVVSQGALADSVAALQQGEARRFRSTWRAGLSGFLRVLGLDVVLILISLALVVAVGAPVALAIWAAVAVSESVALVVLVGFLLGLLGIILLVVALVALTIVARLALRELVVSGERVFGSVAGGFELLWRNLSRSLLVWVILVGLMIGAGIVVAIVVLIMGFLLFGVVYVVSLAEITILTITAGVVAGVLFLVPTVVASAVLGTFQSSYWTLAYLQLTGREA